MNISLEKLVENQLFNNITVQELSTILEPDGYILGHYKKNSVIMQENEPCRSIGFVLSGSLSVLQLSPTGEMMKIEMFGEGDCFGPALLYSCEPFYPYTLFTSSPTDILYLSFSQIEALLKASFVFNINYIAFLSNRVLLFKNKIQILSQKDVRSRLLLYFSNEAKKAGGLTFALTSSKTEIADLLGVARPSVSRELKRMQEDGLLLVDKRQVTIKDLACFHLSVFGGSAL